MKPLKLKKCCICKTEFKAYMSTTKVCSIDCAIEKATKDRIKKEAKELKLTRQKLKEMKEAKLSYWLPKAQFWFNKYIRVVRDGNQACISCGRHHTGQYHAGHYRTVGSAPHLRFSELNCHRQCSVCNNHLSGNLIEYRKGIIKKLGIEKVEQLESDNTARHYTTDDVRELEAYYKAKCKELENA